MANALRQTKPSRRALDPVALSVALTASDSGLSRRGMSALTKLRHRQLQTMRDSQGAFVKIEPRETLPLLDLAKIGRESPLAPDYHSLLLLQLIADFPERAPALRAILLARRTGLDVGKLVDALWRVDGRRTFQQGAVAFMLDPHLLAGTLWVALKPLYESVALAFARHFEAPGSGKDCPVCAGPAWAKCARRLRCAICETVWDGDPGGSMFTGAGGRQARGARRVYDIKTGRRLFELDETLFEHAFDPGPVIELLQLLEAA